jgi:hypothetical protein
MLAIFSIFFTACTFEENLPQIDLEGTVRIPIEAATFTLGQDEEAREITDARGIGPVYVGVFPSVQQGLYDYPHPEIGPIVGDDGNTYPYGGNTLGRFDWACYQTLACKVVTGRFSSYDDLLDFFKNTLEEPIRTLEGAEVTSSTEFQERCFEVLYSTGDFEMLFIGEQDFEEKDGYYVADFTLPDSYFKEGMQVWGWVDMPDEFFDFSTCDPNIGDMVTYYNERYDLGTNYLDVLNYPGQYIDDGDWISSEGVPINSASDTFDLVLDQQFLIAE